MLAVSPRVPSRATLNVFRYLQSSPRVFAVSGVQMVFIAVSFESRRRRGKLPVMDGTRGGITFEGFPIVLREMFKEPLRIRKAAKMEYWAAACAQYKRLQVVSVSNGSSGHPIPDGARVSPNASLEAAALPPFRCCARLGRMHSTDCIS